MGFIFEEVYTGDVSIELNFSCFTLPQTNAYQAVLNLIFAGEGYALSSQGAGILGQFSIKTHSAPSLDYTWFTFSNRTFSRTTSTSPRLTDGRVRFVRRASALSAFYWKGNGWVEISFSTTLPAGQPMLLPGPLRLGVLVENNYVSAYSIGLRRTLIIPDEDGDGVVDDAEALMGTSPSHPDTDGDGLGDWDDPRPLDPAVAFPLPPADFVPWRPLAGPLSPSTHHYPGPPTQSRTRTRPPAIPPPRLPLLTPCGARCGAAQGASRRRPRCTLRRTARGRWCSCATRPPPPPGAPPPPPGSPRWASPRRPAQRRARCRGIRHIA
jgi:hypothetical protein